MKITIQTLATDDENGTQSFAFATEDQLHRHLYETVVEPNNGDLVSYEAFVKDPHEYVQIFSGYLDTFSTDEVVVEIPLWKILRDNLVPRRWR
ncbi:hypothetical protein NKK48_30250 [Mesorhizobium sp. C386A]|uniref:hypothetical protein n=1 Tax=unclassified Mesorhizobium TaxID=325217 RepID=UPI0003CDDA67|nr:hypothetical protein [Mesorhizobium sp. LNJC386A00]ESY35719.1 hypothetical protein X748_13970 [Mesorhizobium sp. LNJC386A00]